MPCRVVEGAGGGASGEHIVVVLIGRIPALKGVVVEDTIFVGEVVDNRARRIGAGGIDCSKVRAKEATKAVVPWPAANSRDRVHLRAAATVSNAQEGSPRFAISGHARFGNCSADLVCTSQTRGLAVT